MIPIEELKLEKLEVQHGIDHSFDDTYWGIETKKDVFERLFASCLLMIPIEELKHTTSAGNQGVETWLLMIPIEELKPAEIAKSVISAAAFDDTYWGIETLCTQSLQHPAPYFWWYLLRNWNTVWKPVGDSFFHFWWYLLRNWNLGFSAPCVSCAGLLMIPIEELKHHSLSRTSVGAILLMIPIEELKLGFVTSPVTLLMAFDDTYWGIETPWRSLLSTSASTAFDDTYWGIETRPCMGLCCPVAPTFDDTYWGIET